MNKNNFQHAFSLVELMISLIVISLVTTAFAPIITKKLSNSTIKLGSGMSNLSAGCITNCLLCQNDKCILCGTNYTYDSNSNTCINCKEKFGYNVEECTVEKPIRCSLGYYLKDNACIKCEAGYYCPDGSGKNSCTNAGYTSLEGAKADSECFLAYQGETFYQDATWTVPEGVSRVNITLVGGGDGGDSGTIKIAEISSTAHGDYSFPASGVKNITFWACGAGGANGVQGGAYGQSSGARGNYITGTINVAEAFGNVSTIEYHVGGTAGACTDKAKALGGTGGAGGSRQQGGTNGSSGTYGCGGAGGIGRTYGNCGVAQGTNGGGGGGATFFYGGINGNKLYENAMYVAGGGGGGAGCWSAAADCTTGAWKISDSGGGGGGGGVTGAPGGTDTTANVGCDGHAVANGAEVPSGAPINSTTNCAKNKDGAMVISYDKSEKGGNGGNSGRKLVIPNVVVSKGEKYVIKIGTGGAGGSAPSLTTCASNVSCYNAGKSGSGTTIEIKGNTYTSNNGEIINSATSGTSTSAGNGGKGINNRGDGGKGGACGAYAGANGTNGYVQIENVVP